MSLPGNIEFVVCQ